MNSNSGQLKYFLPHPQSVAQTQATCEQHGPFLQYLTNGHLSTCPGCIKDDAAEAWSAQTEMGRKNSAVLQAVENQIIPERFEHSTFANYFVTEGVKQERFHKAMSLYGNNVGEYIAKGVCLIVYGTLGTGKTHLSVAIMREAIVRGFSAKLIEAAAIFRTAKGIRESQVIEELSAVDLLVIDELGVQQGSDDEIIRLTTLANERYAKRKPTIWLSNLNFEALSKLLGPRTIDRMKEDGGTSIYCDWKSYRGRAEKPKCAEALSRILSE